MNNKEIEMKNISTDDKIDIIPVKSISNSTAQDALENGYDYYAKQIKSILPNLPPVDLSLKGVNYITSVPKRDSKHDVVNIISGLYRQVRSIIPIGLYTKQTIVQNITFRFKPGTSTLVMGPPCCGSSTVLKMIGGLLPKSDLSGSITCNGKSLR